MKLTELALGSLPPGSDAGVVTAGMREQLDGLAYSSRDLYSGLYSGPIAAQAHVEDLKTASTAKGRLWQRLLCGHGSLLALSG